MKLFSSVKKKRKASVSEKEAEQPKDESSKLRKNETKPLKSYFAAREASTKDGGKLSNHPKKSVNTEIPHLLSLPVEQLTSYQRRLLQRYETRKKKEEESSDLSPKSEKNESGENKKTLTTFKQITVDLSITMKLQKEDEKPEKDLKSKNDSSTTVKLHEQNQDEAIIRKQHESTGSEQDEEKKSVTIKSSAEKGESMKLPSLEGLNSKDRRKVLREYQRTHELSIDELNSLIEESKRIAETNKRIDESQSKQTDITIDSEEKEKEESENKSSDKVEKNFSLLPPEERLRREKQRKMQKEAMERRLREEELGISNKFRHPLNSERRRANRRKPSKISHIIARKELMRTRFARR